MKCFIVFAALLAVAMAAAVDSKEEGEEDGVFGKSVIY